ncbi:MULTISPECIES: hypothetical protein [Streptomyces]|uniref:Uncharacterized protein n=2 Tax=Streptomyces rimosus subsp. rimosus TaxID=132474 RepID=L8F396_STRR1|nr:MULTISPECIES: hypothetical protein [Streptomyces]KOG67275.1 hypothetical protein ADK78_41525 [Kitasatospora aureofaciens]MYT41877.1 hypothetical protein [Streptomyces sp. SID5471]KOT25903.1 hypothetical protein ADK42_40185 [Streptomyces rimosus subsp. rimosus]KOT25917.1 hypothetical protein ADK84_41750 [Streptomyces sp. NRRL WC-3701]KOT66973.1 hypothetical protein ADK47_41395 [Streptomyces rimosus subsp. rimosus]
MTPDAEPISITRGQGDQVEVEGAIDPLAQNALSRAGFLFEPSLHGQWVRLPFDMGRNWENAHATWAAEMLSAARYPVRLDPTLHHEAPAAVVASGPRRPAATTAQAPPGRAPHR